MNTTINVLSNKLQALMGDVHFKSNFDQALDSPEQLLEIGEHNLREYEKIEAMDEELKERIQNLISNILAGALQKKAIEKYGNTGGGSIRKVLYDQHKQPEAQAYWNRLRQTTERGLRGFGLTEEQRDAVMKGMFDKLPQAIMEAIEEFISPFCFLPCSEAQSIATALTDMMKEVENADTCRYN